MPRSFLPEPIDGGGKKVYPSTLEVGNAATIAARFDDEPVALTDVVGGGGVEERQDAEMLEEVEWVDEGGGEGAAVGLRPGPSPEDLAEEEIERGRRGAVEEKPAGRRAARKRTALKVEESRVSWVEWWRGRRNPLIFGGVALLVVGTFGFLSWRSRMAELPKIAEAGRVEGLAALDAGKFDKAHQLLSEAKRAVVSLGDAFEGAEAIKQGADEAAIITQLATASLEEILEQASRADPKEWTKEFERLYRGRSVIMDVHVTGVPNGQGEGAYALDYRVFRAGEGGAPQSMGRVDTTGFRLFELIKPKVGDRLTFGARLGSFQFDGRDEWLVKFEPESGVIMTHAKALEALGWPPAGENGGEDQP